MFGYEDEDDARFVFFRLACFRILFHPDVTLECTLFQQVRRLGGLRTYDRISSLGPAPKHEPAGWRDRDESLPSVQDAHHPHSAIHEPREKNLYEYFESEKEDFWRRGNVAEKKKRSGNDYTTVHFAKQFQFCRGWVEED